MDLNLGKLTACCKWSLPLDFNGVAHGNFLSSPLAVIIRLRLNSKEVSNACALTSDVKLEKYILSLCPSIPFWKWWRKVTLSKYRLLMGLYISPFQSVLSFTVGNWLIKWILKKSGIDPSFTTHSTRSATASW